MYHHIEGNIYTIPVTLPDTPLKQLNAYVIRGEDRSLLIDTGFNCETSWESLSAGLRELELDMDRMDIFLTHAHADHAGLSTRASAPGTRVYISRRDLELLHLMTSPENDVRNRALNLQNGFPPSQLEGVAAAPLSNYLCADIRGFVPVEDGHTFAYGGRTLTAIATPGHTPGHMCLYDMAHQIMFLGDHVLFDISPNITVWQNFPNALGSYVHSLQKIARYDVRLALPAHRGTAGSMEDRIVQIMEHHGMRLHEMYEQLLETAGLTPYEIASRMSWSIHGDGGWETVPYSQKWFAVREAMAHLEYLRLGDQIRMETREGVNYYHP